MLQKGFKLHFDQTSSRLWNQTFRLKKDWRSTSQKGRDREAPSIYFPFIRVPKSPAGPALTCPQTSSPHQAAGIAKCSATKQALPNTTDAEVAKEVRERK